MDRSQVLPVLPTPTTLPDQADPDPISHDKIMPALGKRFLRDVLSNVASLAILASAGMLMNALILAFYGPAALGSFNQVLAIFLVMTQFAVGGLQSSALKHCSHSKDDLEQCSSIVASALWAVALGGAVLAFAVFSARNLAVFILNSHTVGHGLAMAAPGILFFSMNKVLLMALNGMRHMRAFAVFQSFRYVSLLGCMMTLLLAGVPAIWLPLSLTITELLLFLAQLLYLMRFLTLLRLPFSFQLRPWFARHYSFGARGFFSGVLVQFNTRVDVLMLGLFHTDAIVGIYSFAAVFAEGFAQLTVIVRQNLDPIFGRAFAQGQLDLIAAVAQSVRRRLWPIMCGLGFMLAAVFPLIVWLLSPSNQTWHSWPVLCILTGGVVAGAGYRPLAGVFIVGDRPGVYTLLVATVVSVNILLNLLLIHIFGFFGAALATSMACILECIAIVLMARRVFGIRL